MLEILSELSVILIRIFAATVAAIILVRLSPILFGFNLSKEIKEGNVAGGVALVAILLLVALIVGLFKL